MLWTAKSSSKHAGKGRSKSEIQNSMQEIPGCMYFFTQHATLLLTHGRDPKRTLAMGITDCDDCCCIGENGHRVLRIVLEEYLGFVPSAGLSNHDSNTLAIKKRERWRHAAMVSGLSESELPLCLQKASQHGHKKQVWILQLEYYTHFVFSVRHSRGE